MEIYMAIINTYLSIVISLLLLVIVLQKKENENYMKQVKKDNKEWKEEVRGLFNNK